MNKGILNFIKEDPQKLYKAKFTKGAKHKKHIARQILTTMVGVTVAIGTLVSALANTSISAQAVGIVYEYTGSSQEYTIPTTGWYKLEAWGAQGQNSPQRTGGKGGYATGTYWLEKGTTITSTIGKIVGNDGGEFGIFRGGTGSKGPTGGSASSIRIGDEFLVVAGGGGAGSVKDDGGAGGIYVADSVDTDYSHTSISDDEFGGGGGAINGYGGNDNVTTALVGSFGCLPFSQGGTQEQMNKFWADAEAIAANPNFANSDPNADHVRFRGKWENAGNTFLYANTSRGVDASKGWCRVWDSNCGDLTANTLAPQWDDRGNVLLASFSYAQIGGWGGGSTSYSEGKYWNTTPVITVRPKEEITFGFSMTNGNVGNPSESELRSGFHEFDDHYFIIKNVDNGTEIIRKTSYDGSMFMTGHENNYTEYVSVSYTNNTNQDVRIQGNAYTHMAFYNGGNSFENSSLGYSISSNIPVNQATGGYSYATTGHQGKDRSFKGGDRAGNGKIVITSLEPELVWANVDTYYEHIVFDPNTGVTSAPDYATIRKDYKSERVLDNSKGIPYTQDQFDSYITQVRRNDEGGTDYDEANGRHIVQYGNWLTNFTYGQNQESSLQFSADKDGFYHYATGWYWNYTNNANWFDADKNNNSTKWASRRYFTDIVGLPSDKVVFTDTPYPLTANSNNATFQIYYVPKKVNMKISGSNVDLSAMYTEWTFGNNNSFNGLYGKNVPLWDALNPIGTIHSTWQTPSASNEITVNNSISYTQYAAVTAKAKEGYLITGYNMNGNPVSVTPTNEYSLKFQMTRWDSINELVIYTKPIEYTIVYNGNGNTGGSTASSSHTYDVPKNLTANGFIRQYITSFNSNGGTSVGSQTTNYSFYGWHTSPQNVDSNSRQYTNGQSVVNLTSTNGGTVNLYATWSSASFTLPTTTRTGYIFEGWYSNSSLTTKVGNAGASYKPTVNTTLYAKWTPIEYDIIYDKNKPSKASHDVTGTTASSHHVYDVAKTLTPNGYSLVGWRFNGWNTKADGKGTSYYDKQSVKNLSTTNGSTVTLYAQWIQNTYTVNIYQNKPSNASHNINRIITPSGYTWNTDHWSKTFTYDDTKIGYSPSQLFSLKGWTIDENNYYAFEA